jgi:hypothetical protein
MFTKLNLYIQKAAQQSTLKKYFSLFPGLGFAAGYKILQRVYKFGGQPYVMDYLNKHHKKDFQSVFGEKSAKTIMHATAGRYVLSFHDWDIFSFLCNTSFINDTVITFQIQFNWYR